MFGVLYTILMSIGALGHKAKDNCQNIENKKKYLNEEEGTYIDTKGNTRLLFSNEYVLRGPGPNGDDVLTDKNGKVIRNFSAEKRAKEISIQFQEAREKGKTVAPAEPLIYHDNGRIPKGRRYMDLETGEFYVVGRIKDYRPGISFVWWKSYYIRVSDGTAVRKTDTQIELDEINKKAIGVVDYDGVDLEEFNKNIRENYHNNPTKSKWQMFYDNYELSNGPLCDD